jgi:Zn-finger nucleic acid-binding protein
MSCAKRLKRVLGIEIDTCARCGGTLRIIASIEPPELIAKILAHLERTAPQPKQPELSLGARASPVPSTLR